MGATGDALKNEGILAPAIVLFISSAVMSLFSSPNNIEKIIYYAVFIVIIWKNYKKSLGFDLGHKLHSKILILIN